jgi:hypothetical protein
MWAELAFLTLGSTVAGMLLWNLAVLGCGAAVGRLPHRQIMTHFRPRKAGAAFASWNEDISKSRGDINE